MTNRSRRHITLAVALLILILSGALLTMRRLFHAPAPDLGGGEVTFSIKAGEPLSAVARRLSAERLISSRLGFIVTARILRADRKIQPGNYLLTHGMSNTELLRQFLRKRAAVEAVTIPEGLTVRQIAGILQISLQLDSAEFVAAASDGEFARRLGINQKSLEGYLYPDTYEFYRASKPADVISKMVGRFQQLITDSIISEAEKLNLTLHELITLASIIQGEVMVWPEAPLISAVYHNRLKRGIPLAADPTIQYILEDGPRRLLKKDMEIQSPYNTYKRAGLPPGPINNPGWQAIEAALKPAQVNYLYFVAQGDGTHAFNTTHDGHLADKARFQAVRRRVAREKLRAQPGASK